MSGTMQQPQAQPQIPPQLLAMLAQRMQQQGGAPAQQPNPQQAAMQQQMAQRQAAMAQQQNQTPPPQGTPPGLAMFGRAAQQQPGPMQPQQGQQMGLRPQETAAMGRFGDTVVSHLAPGEIVINPRMLPPQLMQTIMQAFQQAGVDPRSMVVGSPNAPRNPQTGMEEHNGVLGSLLPLLLGVGGSILAPEALPLLGLDGTIGAGAASAIGGGLGSAAGTALGGGNAAQAITSGLGAGAGNALAGSLLGSTGSGVGNTSAPPSTTQPFGGGMPSGGPAAGGNSTMLTDAPYGAGSAPGAGFDTNAGSGALAGGGPFSTGQLALRGLGAGAGGFIGGAMSPSTQKLSLPQGSIPNYSPTGPNPMSGAPSRPNFTSYNPFASVTGQPFNFYPPGG